MLHITKLESSLWSPKLFSSYLILSLFLLNQMSFGCMHFATKILTLKFCGHNHCLDRDWAWLTLVGKNQARALKSFCLLFNKILFLSQQNTFTFVSKNKVSSSLSELTHFKNKPKMCLLIICCWNLTIHYGRFIIQPYFCCSKFTS